MDERNQLLEQIRLASFGINEMNLFLNTHPNDGNALAHYQRYKSMRDQAWRIYTNKYGPLTTYDSEDNSYWSWVDGPWPWQCY